jgi:hypothetical protein
MENVHHGAAGLVRGNHPPRDGAVIRDAELALYSGADNGPGTVNDVGDGAGPVCRCVPMSVFLAEVQ